MARFYAVSNPTFQRSMRLVDAITNGYPAIVTTSFAHEYEVGDIVRLNVPRWYGMVQANKLVGTILTAGVTTFTIDIDTTYFNPFVIPAPLPWYVDSYPHVTPVGEISANLGGATKNIL